MNKIPISSLVVVIHRDVPDLLRTNNDIRCAKF